MEQKSRVGDWYSISRYILLGINIPLILLSLPSAEKFITFKDGDQLQFGTETIAKVEVRVLDHILFGCFIKALTKPSPLFGCFADCCPTERGHHRAAILRSGMRATRAAH